MIITKRYILTLILLLSFLFPPHAHAKIYKIGDIGPRGGIVFYVLDPETQSLWHYMEVAPDNWDKKDSRMSFLSATKKSYGYDNGSWFVPAKEDMENIYKHKKVLKVSFMLGTYWTSTGTSDFSNLIVINMNNGKSFMSNGKGTRFLRPVRYF